MSSEARGDTKTHLICIYAIVNVHKCGCNNLMSVNVNSQWTWGHLPMCTCPTWTAALRAENSTARGLVTFTWAASLHQQIESKEKWKKHGEAVRNET